MARSPGWLEGFDRGVDSLPRTIALLEHRGGIVVEIRFNGRGGHPGFDAVLERSARVLFVRVEQGASRAAFLPPGPRPPWITAWRNRGQFRAALHAKIDLAQAVATAESDAGNIPSVAAGVAAPAADPLRFSPAFNVLLLTP
jgi:hypothetical protein